MVGALVETESYYDILENSEGELLLSIKARQGGPEKPQILYDGEEHALFYRSADQTIILDYIHPEVRESFRKVKTVLIAEFRDEDIVREYNVSVRQVKKLPLTEEMIKPLKEE